MFAQFSTRPGKVSQVADLQLIAGNSADISKANFENRIEGSNPSVSATHKYLLSLYFLSHRVSLQTLGTV